MSRHGRQTELGTALDSTLRRLDRKSGGAYTSARVTLGWDRIAGAGLAQHTTGAHLRHGVLVVFVDSNTWATQYTAMAEQYRASLNKELGEDLVSSLRFTVSRKVAEAHRIKQAEIEVAEFYTEDDVPSIPLTPTELAQIESSVAEIPDAELREAVLRATVKDMEWKKGLAMKNEAQEPPQGF